jgi:hypothetical protein
VKKINPETEIEESMTDKIVGNLFRATLVAGNEIFNTTNPKLI